VKIVNRKTFAYANTESPNGLGADASSGPEQYLRYQLTRDGVSPMAIPGTAGGGYVATGLEHTQAANTTSDARTHTAMMDKRAKKMDLAREHAPAADYHGDPSSDIGILTWGSTWGSVVEAVNRLAAEGIKAHAMAPRMLWPLATDQLEPFFAGKRVIFVPEVNFSGQFAQILGGHYRTTNFHQINIYGGAAFDVADLVEKVKQGAGVKVHVHA
jgi:2-oxoglutarate ferredoxin oxidoreductase subunit alpha